MKTFRTKAIVFSVTLFLGYFFTQANEATLAEDYTLHTLYIFNFTKYVEWPSRSKAIKIGVVDNASAGQFLEKMAKVKSVAGAEITIVNTRNENELSQCQIIFVPSNNSNLTPKLIERFNSEPILIVTEEADLIKKGACVSFKIISGKLRFQLNEETIKEKGMKISSALTAFAEK